jgi:RNA polymerase sigma-70 factor (ECF subfamily)
VGLESLQRAGGEPWYAALRFRAEHPELRSPELAERLSVQLGRPLTAVGVRQTLHRARDEFADLLLGEVRQSLENPTRERLEQELVELRLYDYCRNALGRDGGEDGPCSPAPPTRRPPGQGPAAAVP